MATNPLFTETFDVKNNNYGDFIAGLRHRLRNPKHFSHNRPVLPPVEPNVRPRRWFHVVLRTQTCALTLATRADNLYLEGFRSSDGTWWELTRGLIDPRATYVGFGGTYHDLLGHTDKLVDVALGPQQMTEAVNVLAARTRADLTSGPKQQQARDALVVLLLMVHEATRFLTVSKKVSDLMDPRAKIKSGKITSQMKKQVNGWKDLSTALLKSDVIVDVKPDKKTEEKTAEETAEMEEKGLFKRFEDMDVKTAEKAAETVGILLFVHDVDVPGMMTTATALQLFRESQLGVRVD